jgi:plasmid stabilization system protein ParE
MRALEWTAAALRDLDGIDAWLSAEADPEAAIRSLSAIRERADFLLDFPRSGPPLEGGTHSLRVRGTDYSLVYRVLDAERIQIVRIFHAKRDWRPA